MGVIIRGFHFLSLGHLGAGGVNHVLGEDFIRGETEVAVVRLLLEVRHGGGRVHGEGVVVGVDGSWRADVLRLDLGGGDGCYLGGLLANFSWDFGDVKR
jgi:hypothetical protein